MSSVEPKGYPTFWDWAEHHPNAVVRLLFGPGLQRPHKERKQRTQPTGRYEYLEERLVTFQAELYNFMEVYNKGVGTVDSNQAENLAELNALTQAVVELKANYQALAKEVFK